MPLSCQSRDVAESPAFSSILPVSACAIPPPIVTLTLHLEKSRPKCQRPKQAKTHTTPHKGYEQNMWSGVMVVLGPTQFAAALVQQLGIFLIVQKRADMLVSGAGKPGGTAATGNYRGG